MKERIKEACFNGFEGPNSEQIAWRFVTEDCKDIVDFIDAADFLLETEPEKIKTIANNLCVSLNHIKPPKTISPGPTNELHTPVKASSTITSSVSVLVEEIRDPAVKERVITALNQKDKELHYLKVIAEFLQGCQSSWKRVSASIKHFLSKWTAYFGPNPPKCGKYWAQDLVTVNKIIHQLSSSTLAV